MWLLQEVLPNIPGPLPTLQGTGFGTSWTTGTESSPVTVRGHQCVVAAWSTTQIVCSVDFVSEPSNNLVTVTLATGTGGVEESMSWDLGRGEAFVGAPSDLPQIVSVLSQIGQETDWAGDR